jgi:hypothetical protein
MDAHDMYMPMDMMGMDDNTRSLTTELVCSRCAHRRQHPGPPTAADLDAGCAACGGVLRAVTVYRLDTGRP